MRFRTVFSARRSDQRPVVRRQDVLFEIFESNKSKIQTSSWPDRRRGQVWLVARVLFVEARKNSNC